MRRRSNAKLSGGSYNVDSMTDSSVVDAFIRAATVPMTGGYESGTVDEAEALRSTHPDVTRAIIHAAAVAGDVEAVRGFVTANPSHATRKGGPYDWDPLTYLCFSRYLRLRRSHSKHFVNVAAALLDAGANPNAGWYESQHHWESAIYGASGVGRNPALTRLLLERGADPNDGETPYHVIESYDNTTLVILLESGKLNADSLATVLVRKADWHDFEGIWLALHHGADVNARTRWGGRTALHQALLRDNRLSIITLLLEAGADPTIECEIGVPPAVAARRGRGDVFELFERRGIVWSLHGVDALLAACARDDEAQMGQFATDPSTVAAVTSDGAALGAFAGVGNAKGVRRLLALGVPVDAMWKEGDGYYGTASGSTALHVAAWRMQHDVVALLLEHGANVNAVDGQGRTPLVLAVRACVDSHWSGRRSPESVEMLIDAGASVEAVRHPSGYDEVDELLRAAGERL
jgi:ankyrin repeat protein